MGWKYISIIIGILGTFLGVYFREAFRKAVATKNVIRNGLAILGVDAPEKM